MHRKTQNSSPEDGEYKDFKRFSEENQELHKYARKILEMIGQEGNEKHKEFTQKLLKKYEAVPFNRKHYGQDWSSYNATQQKEKIILMNILDELLSYIPFPEKKGVGRNPVSFRDKIFSVILQSYNIKSSRRCVSDIELSKKAGYMGRKLHFNTVLKVLKDPSITHYLKHLVQVSGIPLQQIESDFAVDASGFSTSEFDRWLDVRTGTNEQKRKFVKTHITCGVRTNIITAVNITKSSRHDSVEFEGLIKDTNRIYNMKEVSADKGYISAKNLEAVSDLGAIPFIPFKSNVSKKSVHKRGSVWKKMYRFFIDYPDEFKHHYHKRSNVETCFHMLKKKFGKHLRSRSKTGQANEILAKCLCHNLCVLAQEALEIGIDIDFKKCANIPFAHK